METHKEAVAKIATQIKTFHERKEPFRIYHGHTNSTRPSQRRKDQMIDTSQLNHILEVNTTSRFALVECNVPMDALVAATLPHKLVPPVVMEYPGITTGGGFAGTGGESSSFRYGFFDRTVSWIEIVLANGDVQTASRERNPELLNGAACCFGTIGITTLLKVDLIPAKDYVELTYLPITSMDEAMAKIKKTTADPSIDYVDGMLFAADRGVICSGRLSDKPAGQVQTFSRRADPWFYLHAEEVSKQSQGPTVESIPLVEYLFRYDRGAFWVAKYAFDYFLAPFLPLTRWVVDYWMHTRVMYHALHTSGHSRRYIVQDVMVSYLQASEFLEHIDKTFGHYPLWLCPLHQRGISQRLPLGPLAEKSNAKIPDLLLNFGIWGPGPTGKRESVEANRRLERKALQLNGRQWLYSHTYNTEEEFWSLYDRESYDALRAKYGAMYLPSIYDKVKVDVVEEETAIRNSWVLWLQSLFWTIWPLSGIYGIYSSWRGGDYLIRQTVRWDDAQKAKAQ